MSMSLSQSMPRISVRPDGALDQNGSTHLDGSDEKSAREMKRRHSSPFKPYSGDIFGTQGDYLPGMLYLSRMKVHQNPIDTVERFQQAKAKYQAKQAGKAASTAAAAEEAALASDSGTVVDSDEKLEQIGPQSLKVSALATASKLEDGDTSTITDMKHTSVLEKEISSSQLLGSQRNFSPAMSYDIELQSKRDCAAALCSLVGNQELSDEVMEDGMIEAFTQLALTSDSQIRLSCSRALCRLSGNHLNWPQMVEEGAVTALLTLSSGLNSEDEVDKHMPNSEVPDSVDDSDDDEDKQLTTRAGIENIKSHVDWASQLCAIGLANLACLEESTNAFFQAGIHLELTRKSQMLEPQDLYLHSTARLLFNLSHVDGNVLGLEQLAQSVCKMTKTVEKAQNRKIKLQRYTYEKNLERNLRSKKSKTSNGWLRGSMEKPFLFEMAIECRDLADLDELSGSDPMCVLSQRATTHGPWYEAGRSEVIQNDRNPVFKKRFQLVCHPMEKHFLKFDIYDVDAARAGGTDRIDLTQQDYAGSAIIQISDILNEPTGTYTIALNGAEEVEGTLTIRARVLFYGDDRDDDGDDRVDDDPKKFKEVRRAVAQARVEQYAHESKLRHFILGAIFTLSHVEGMPILLLHEGVLEAIRGILTSAAVFRYPERLHLCAMVAAIMYVMSSTTRICWLLVEQGGFQILDIILAEAQKCKCAAESQIQSGFNLSESKRESLQTLRSESIDVIFMCMGTLSNIALEERCRKRMLNESAARTLIALAAPGNGPQVRSACATAIKSLASSKDSALFVTSIGGLDALISMSNEESESIRRECFRALCTILSCDFDELIQRCGRLKDSTSDLYFNQSKSEVAKHSSPSKGFSLADRGKTFEQVAQKSIRVGVIASLSIHESRAKYMKNALAKVIGNEADYEILCSSLTLVSMLFNISCSAQGRKLLLLRDPDGPPNTRYRILDTLLHFAANGGRPGTGKAILARKSLQTVYNLSCCKEGVRLIIESGRVMR